MDKIEILQLKLDIFNYIDSDATLQAKIKHETLKERRRLEIIAADYAEALKNWR
jgi:hypothetical protein